MKAMAECVNKCKGLILRPALETYFVLSFESLYSNRYREI
jgi:hypothetical protein